MSSAAPSAQQFSRRQRQIMDIIYREGEASVSQIRDALPDPPSHTAVRTFLKILEDKGCVKRRKLGRAHVYKPKAPRARAGRNAIARVIETFFEGSIEKAVSAHLTDNMTKLSDDELNRLMQMIHDARKRGS